MSRDERFLSRALGIALTSQCRWKHGCIITRGSKILTWSTNIYRNPSDVDYKGATWHAEVAALRELDRLTGATYGEGMYKGLTIYIARVNRQGTARISRPCANCSTQLTDRGIYDRVFTNELGLMSHETIS
jgi:deoxycytidylate deaminase